MKNKLKLVLILLVGFASSCGSQYTSDQKEEHSTKPETSETSEITCPKCNYKKVEKLPTDVCQLAYTCEKCDTVLHPKEGDCCVFCTYGDHKCPSMQ